MISNNLTSIIKESLAHRTEFWESSKTLKVLSEEDYFRNKESEEIEWPDVLKKMMSDSKYDFLWALLWENLTLFHANNKGADQPAHPRSLISAFVICFL